ncbi:Pif-6 [Phenacoccus solenopsis nudivirus]|nr:Pif-6 [Phenacoccus solenopsis nudivirus]
MSTMAKLIPTKLSKIDTRSVDARNANKLSSANQRRQIELFSIDDATTDVFVNNVANRTGFIYPLELATLSTRVSSKELLMQTQLLVVYIIPIPDGVSPYVNEDRMPKNKSLNRIHVYSDSRLTDTDLQFIANQCVDVVPYPFVGLQDITPSCELTPTGDCDYKIANVNQLPTCNFYMRNPLVGKLDTFALIEVKWFRQRNVSTTKYFDPLTATATALVPPDEVAYPIVLVMPSDYVSVSSKHGYFFDERCQLMLHIFSRHYMKAKDRFTIDVYPNERLISSSVLHRDAFNDISNDTTSLKSCINSTNVLNNEHLLRYVRHLFTKLGFLKLYAINYNTLVAEDDHCIIVYGDYTLVSLY